MRAASLLLGLTLTACAAEIPDEVQGRGPYQSGLASYYTDRLAGHRTANGERYDPHAFTAAHRKLPLGSIVEVVRKDGRAVRVRINDRGPYAAGRIVDLSRHAAEALGMIKAGVVEVSLYLVWSPPPRHAKR